MNSVIPFFVLLCLHSRYSNVHSRHSKVVLNARGAAATVFTPMNNDQTVNFDVIPRYARYLHDHGVKLILVGDLASEIINLSLPDAEHVVKAWVDACKCLGIRVMVQVGGRPFVEVIEMAKYCASLEVEALLTLSDPVFKPTTIDEAISYVKLVADAAPNVPLLYDHVPKITGLAGLMPEFVVLATCKISNFRGLRFRDGDLTEAYRTCNNLKEGQELFYSGPEVLAAVTALGMKSTTLIITNIFPKLVQEVISSQTAGDSKTAKHKNLQLAEAVFAINSRGRVVPTLKPTMEMVTGLPMGPPVLPQRQISNETLDSIRQELITIGVLECYDSY